MKSREPVLTRGRDEWDRVNLPAAEFHGRVADIRAAMAEADVDALFVYGRGDRDGHLCYVTNLINKVPVWGIMATITADTVVVRNERSSRTRPVLERATWVDDIQFCDYVVTGLDDLVDPSAIARVATAGFDTMPYPQRERFREETATVEVEPFDARLYSLRRAKSPKETDQVARAGRIVGELHQFIAEREPDRVRETAVAAEVDHRARLRGVQDVRLLVANPTETEPDLRPVERRWIEPDAPVSVYIACRFEGYWAEATRPLRLDGEVPNARDFDEARERYEAYLDAFQVGADPSVVTDPAADATSARYTLGSGIGLEVDEPPQLGTHTDMALLPGMTLSPQLAVEPAAEALLVFGDTIVVRDGGPSVLTSEEPSG